MFSVQISYNFSSDGFSVVNHLLIADVERELYTFAADNSSYFDENKQTARGVSICKDVKKYVLCVKIEEHTVSLTLLVDGQSRYDYIACSEFKQTRTIRRQLMNLFKPFQPEHIAFLEKDYVLAEAMDQRMGETIQ